MRANESNEFNAISTVRKFADNVEGWLSEREGKLLYSLARNCTGKGTIVEIGSWKGKSTVWLGSGSKSGNNVKIYAIDPHTGSEEHRKKYGKVWTFEEFKKNVKAANVASLIVPIVETSEEAAKGFNEPVELLFIDGAHEYELTKLDYELWAPKVVDGGIIAFHDTVKWPGPAKVVRDSMFLSKNFRNVRLVDTITYGQKVRQNTFSDRLKNRYSLLLKGFHELADELADKLRLPKRVRMAGKRLLAAMQK